MIAPLLIERARAARQSVDAAKAKITAERSRLSELRMQQRDSDAERERLREEEERDAATRLLDGEAAAPPKTRRANRLIKLDAGAPALAAAIKQQQQRVSDAETAVHVPVMPLVEAALDIVSEIQGDGVEEARSALAALAPSFARLIAADQVRLALIGERFPMPRDRAPPFKGLMLFQALSEAIPQRLRPPELNEKPLLDAARKISSDIVAQIEGTPS